MKVFLLLLFILSSCVHRSLEYREFYSHLKKNSSAWRHLTPSDYFLVILVDARHLDYTQGSKFFQSVAKHPSDGSKNGDVGHAWIYLQGEYKGQIIAIEGGHSGERESYPAHYFDGIMNYNDFGYANPTQEEQLDPGFEPNPIKYLWSEREDGFFQKGSGGHRPTFAAKVSLTQKQFEEILYFIHPMNYCYKNYALTGQQCSSFVTQVAAIAGLYLPSTISMKIEPKVYYGRRSIRLWSDPAFSEISIATPDVIEKSLMDKVESGQAEEALTWYLKTNNYKN